MSHHIVTSRRDGAGFGSGPTVSENDLPDLRRCVDLSIALSGFGLGWIPRRAL
jgi:hypothetical protein